MRKKNSVTQRPIILTTHRWSQEDAHISTESWDHNPHLGYQYQSTWDMHLYYSTLRMEDFKSLERQARQGFALNAGDLPHITDHYAEELEVLLNSTNAIKNLPSIEPLYFSSLIIQGMMENEKILRTMSNFCIKKGYSKERIMLILAEMSVSDLMPESLLTQMNLAIENAWVAHEHSRLQRTLKANTSKSKLEKI